MDPRLLRAGLRIGVLVLVLALAVLPFEPPGSAESVVSALAAIVGGAFVLGVVLLARTGRDRLPDDKPRGKDYNVRSTPRGG